ncbi:MAG: PilZ domain-containing protein [Candidatus Brocadiia bacterium]
MRQAIEEVLRSLSVEELREARRTIDELLARRAGPARPQPRGWGGPDRRAFERHPIDLEVSFLRHRPGGPGRRGEQGLHRAMVRDISRGGLRLFTRAGLEPGEVLTVYLPGSLGERRVFVEVARAERRGDQWECGASFVGLDRVLASHRPEEEGRLAQVCVACEPGPERERLTGLLVKQGYTVYVANSVPEAVSLVGAHGCSLVLAAAPLLVAEGGRLVAELAARRQRVVTIALASASALEGPGGEALRACDDYIAEPQRPDEVGLVVGRCYRRLVAARGGEAP